MEPRVIVITGASSGIGAALARKLASKGHALVLAARRESELRAVATECGERALPIVADVCRQSEVEAIRDRAINAFEGVDVWINNAGRGIGRKVMELSEEDLDEMMAVNFKSAWYAMQAIVPHFQARGRGHIINVSSLLGRVPLAPIRSAYGAAKHALNALTANLRLELRAEYPNIHVTTVSPGVVATDFGKKSVGGGPDSRSLPNAQPASEVAEVIAQVIEAPRTDVYTRPMYKQLIERYYAADDLATVEGQPPFAGPR